MTDLGAFYDNSFDVVTACYGYMFPDDKARALRETHRVLKPGGKLIATYWLEMQMLPLLGEVMTAVLGRRRRLLRRILSLKEPGVFEDMLVTAGFETPTVMESSYPFNIGTDPDFQYVLCAAVEPSGLQPSCARTISPYDFVSFLGAHRGTMLVKPKLDELDGHAVACEVMFKRLPDFSSKDSDGSICWA